MEKVLKEIEDHLKAAGKQVRSSNPFPVAKPTNGVTGFISLLIYDPEIGEETTLVAKVLGTYWVLYAQIP